MERATPAKNVREGYERLGSKSGRESISTRLFYIPLAASTLSMCPRINPQSPEVTCTLQEDIRVYDPTIFAFFEETEKGTKGIHQLSLLTQSTLHSPRWFSEVVL